MFNIDNSFTHNLPVDIDPSLNPHQVFNACYSWVKPKTAPSPKLLHVSEEFAKELGFDDKFIKSKEFLQIFSGNQEVSGSKPYAMAYAGHQFGSWAGQLGDGRAINIAEVVVDKNAEPVGRYVLQLKGSGRTPYSRSGDGLAVLRSSIREHLCSEAMHHLRIPTTRSLSLMLTGEDVLRDMFYDGNVEYEKGAVICRASPSFIRFGNFQLLSAQSDFETLQMLTDYTIEYFYPELKNSEQKVNLFFDKVCELTEQLVIEWQRVGFVHGVMNTDNMSILGLTIDYGPYGWTDDFNLDWTPNTTDKSNRRYRFGQQTKVAIWNLWQLANALVPVAEDREELEATLIKYQASIEKKYRLMMYKKIGLTKESETSQDSFIKELEQLLKQSEIDMTIFFRQLANFNHREGLVPDLMKSQLKEALYNESKLSSDMMNKWMEWMAIYVEKLNNQDSDISVKKEQMNRVNPKYVLRNYMAQMAIDEADKGNYDMLNEMYNMLKNPYDEQPEYEKWFAKRPDWAKTKAGCSMLSCSS